VALRGLSTAEGMMRDDRARGLEERPRLGRWGAVVLFWLGVMVAAVVSAALILGFDLFLRIAFHGPRTKTVLLVLVGASLVFILLRADWVLYREARRVQREQERGTSDEER
jgi:hypothetical protein